MSIYKHVHLASTPGPGVLGNWVSSISHNWYMGSGKTYTSTSGLQLLLILLDSIVSLTGPVECA